MRLLRLSALLFVLMSVAAVQSLVAAVAAQSMTIDVHFKLTDLDYKPIPGATVRVVFADEPWREPPTAGQTFVTDSGGEHRFTANAVIDTRRRKLPTNFVDSLFSLPKVTNHLVLGTELSYLTYRWLYIVELFRFPNGGDVMFEGVSVYNRDSQGRFSRRATNQGHDWHMPDLTGLVLTSPGHEVFDYLLDEKPGVPDAWTLRLAFKKYPEPVRR